MPDIYQTSANLARKQEQMTDNQEKMKQHEQIIVWASLGYPDMDFQTVMSSLSDKNGRFLLGLRN